MSNIFTRIKDSISADLHQMMDKKEQNNPMAALNGYLRQSEQEKEKVRRLVERQYRLKEEFAREYHRAQDMANKRGGQASIAQQAGEQEMYEFAMKEHKDYQARANHMESVREEAVEQLDQLEKKYAEMKYKIKDMQLKRMELMGRENIARASERMNKVIDETTTKPFSRFEELERYIEDIEYKVNSNYYRNTFDSKVDQLEREMKEAKEA